MHLWREFYRIYLRDFLKSKINTLSVYDELQSRSYYLNHGFFDDMKEIEEFYTKLESYLSKKIFYKEINIRLSHFSVRIDSIRLSQMKK
jgi:hypothetical protein